MAAAQCNAKSIRADVDLRTAVTCYTAESAHSPPAQQCLCVLAQAGVTSDANQADSNHNGIPDGYEFAQTADFYNHHEWRQRGVPMAALLGTSSTDFHPAERMQVFPSTSLGKHSVPCDGSRAKTAPVLLSTDRLSFRTRYVSSALCRRLSTRRSW